MNAQLKNGFMLIFRGNEWRKGLSPEEMQNISDQWMAWFKWLMDEGRAIAGNRLEPKVKIISGKNGHVADGPFAESKEAVGGYFLLVAGECPMATEARAESLPALAAA